MALNISSDDRGEITEIRGGSTNFGADTMKRANFSSDPTSALAAARKWSAESVYFVDRFRDNRENMPLSPTVTDSRLSVTMFLNWFLSLSSEADRSATGLLRDQVTVIVRPERSLGP
ncbi:hypothetical protein [Nocardia sp. NRRL WC-3656]|uniref:hypothetical protein n=1 Tax=Nocardia sp. NRRL WC-3656 TaxID=1463824 RepID=UPI0018CC05A2|nr:hypothetical protein [Nocardia sp. NRRL WC-3656]